MYNLLGPLIGHAGIRLPVPRIREYCELTIPSYSRREFRRHFRLQISTFDVLVASLWAFPEFAHADEQVGRPGRPALSLEKKVLLTLWMLSTPESYRSIASRFGVSESTAHGAVFSVVEGINRHLVSKLIVWPTGAIVEEVLDGFRERRGMQGVLGAIDVTLIAIKAPTTHQEDYINRKGFHSMQLHAVCDHDMLFTDCFTGWPGSVHDARVLRNSPVYHDGSFPRGSFLVGDSAYPLQSWLLTPFRDNGHLTAEQRNYNYLHSSTRMVIERAFSLLKGRFRRLKYVDMTDTAQVSLFIMASCALHNLCIINEDDFEDLMDDAADDHDYHPPAARDIAAHAVRAGQEKRRPVMMELPRVI